jgi:opacity protein-like surface antigen
MNKSYLLFAMCLLILAINLPAQAQLGLGISYEERPDAPTQGFGVQLETELLPLNLIATLKARLHFSYFDQDARLSVPIDGSPSVELGKIENYDFGAALLGGVNLGFFTPYAGLGAGMDNWKFQLQLYNQSFDKQALQYYGILGASLSILPKLEPYVEYRVSEYGSIEDARKQIDEGNGRFIVGLTLRF